MIIITQLVVILAALFLLSVALGGRRTHVARAWKKIGLVFLSLSMVIAVLFPEITNRAANLVGVGRGADLLLYLMTLVFITYVLNNYLYQQEEKDALYRLARKIALIDAAERYNKLKK